VHSHPTTEISATDAVELLTGADAVLLDVRERHEWDAGHAPQVAWEAAGLPVVDEAGAPGAVI